MYMHLYLTCGLVGVAREQVDVAPLAALAHRNRVRKWRAKREDLNLLCGGIEEW